MCASIVPAAKMGYYRQHTPSSGRLMSTIIDTFVAPPCREQITLLYQDEHLVLINKPAGLLSLSGKDPRNLDSVHHRLVQRFPGCTLVHRLDFGTSGLMVIARNKGINALLCQQFSQRTVDKVYTALLCGHLAEDEGIVEAAIAKDPAHFPRMALCARHGKTGAFALSGHRPPVSGARRREGAGVNPGDAHTRRPDGPISCVFTASCWAIRSLAAICTVAGSCPARNALRG